MKKLIAVTTLATCCIATSVFANQQEGCVSPEILGEIGLVPTFSNEEQAESYLINCELDGSGFVVNKVIADVQDETIFYIAPEEVQIADNYYGTECVMGSHWPC